MEKLNGWMLSLGLTVSGNIEVFGDLKPGDEVIRNATDAIRPGQQVKTAASHS